MSKIEVNSIGELVDLNIGDFVNFLATQSIGSIKCYKDSLISEQQEVERGIQGIQSIIATKEMNKEDRLEHINSYACLVLASYKIREKVTIIDSIEEKLKGIKVCDCQSECKNSGTDKCSYCCENNSLTRGTREIDLNFEQI